MNHQAAQAFHSVLAIREALRRRNGGTMNTERTMAARRNWALRQWGIEYRERALRAPDRSTIDAWTAACAHEREAVKREIAALEGVTEELRQKIETL